MKTGHRASRVAAIVLVLAPAAISAAEAPAWFIEHMTGRVEGGRWVTDNPYRSDEEPYESYGMEWVWGLGKQSMIGRLFGYQDGEETVDFWQFRVFWHPGEDEASIYQWGHGGVVGIGTISAVENGTRSEQTFHSPDGTTSRTGHESIESATEMDTRSFNISEDGEWTPRRHYIWHAEGGRSGDDTDE